MVCAQPSFAHFSCLRANHDEKPISDVAAETNKSELDILYLLADPNDGPALWTVEEIARELNNHDAIDWVNGLHRVGLIHAPQMGSFSLAARQCGRRSWSATSCDARERRRHARTRVWRCSLSSTAPACLRATIGCRVTRPRW
ncbi:MAG TPA: hypothetical protein VIH71_16760 [Solirubrobacteraceae bacterium]